MSKNKLFVLVLSCLFVSLANGATITTNEATGASVSTGSVQHHHPSARKKPHHAAAVVHRGPSVRNPINKSTPRASTKKKPTSKKVVQGKIKKKERYMQGVASFYGDGDGFNGKRMANGRRFNEDNPHMSAHPTLPLGTKLLVTNLNNGREIYVEVTDRMPARQRVIDLSKAAAAYLGMYHRGISRVQLQVITDQEYNERKQYLLVDDYDSGRRY